MSASLPDSALNEFFSECEEILHRVSEHLRLMENGTSTQNDIDQIYRDIHTLKGSAQLFGYQQIGQVAHAMETCLDPVRKNRIKPEPKLIEALYSCLSVIERILNNIKAKKVEDFKELLSSSITELMDSSIQAAGGALKPIFEPILALNRVQIESAPLVPETKTMNKNPIQQKIAEAPKAPSESALSASPVPEAAVPATSSSESVESTSTIRVPVALLDKLMTLMGEMVLVRNQVLQYAIKSDHLEFHNLSQRLDVVTSEIQGEVMKTRMQPIGNILTKFQRVVRDLSKELGKKVELILSGTETELDKTLLEAVKDPLMHIVRNSCDHGIESIEDRRAAGKPELGTITIRSFHEGGQVIIEITDDGRGLHRQKLIQKAIEKGLITSEKGALLSDRDAFSLIFAPGFSTASQVTNVSGRGVGMDVVKNNIEGIGGHVELQSQPNRGTTTRLKIPLTLAIVPAMIVRNRDERFAIPQVKLVELVRVEQNSTTQSIELLQGKPVYRLRGNLLPLVKLDQVLNLPDSSDSKSSEATIIAILSADGLMFGLIVDEVLDTTEVVVKPLNSFLKVLSIYSGATVLGDGAVAIILDVMGIAQQQKLITEGTHGNSKTRAGEEEDITMSEAQEFLLFKLHSPTKHAIPLGLVHRLEEFDRSAIEYSGSQRVVRYRNSVLPIVSLNEFLGFELIPTDPPTPPASSISVIVSQKAGRFFGVEVDEILDVLNTTAVMDDSLADRPGIMGNLVTEDEIVVVVDALCILETFAKKMTGGTTQEVEVKKIDKTLKILFAEDTAFFRRHVCTFLQRAGHQVTAVENGAEGIKLLESSSLDEFDIILSDIEMPKMNGLEFARAIRLNEKWNKTPIIALTTRFSASDIEEGKRAGFNSYMEKLNPDVLLSELRSIVLNDEKLRRKVA